MRIERVRFKNLNSLSGEWEIDFSHAAFVTDGIFAITGPTGAGKTTILDAICLALYGRTPRLNKVTKSGNEVMSRQTGECFAEVTFETAAGRFRCHWSQHRARKKPDGELQAPKHEISDADSGKIYEAKLRGVADQIEIATGMDFNRFTRSMLLAQGGFAAFLQAAPDERAPILEQITGTEIYSRISMRVHERRSEERGKLEALSAELAGMQLLEEEDERQLNADLAQKILQEAELNDRIGLNTRSIAWLDGLNRLEDELKRVEEQKRGWLTRHNAFTPEREKLLRATKAMELAGAFAELALQRRDQQNDNGNRSTCLQALPIRKEAVGRAEAALHKAARDLDTQKAALKEALHLIRKARELDLKLREKDAPIIAVGDAIEKQSKLLETLRLKHDADGKALSGKRKELEAIFQCLAEAKADESLVEHLAGIRGRLDSLGQHYTHKCAKAEEVKTAEKQILETTRVWNEKAAGFKIAEKQFDAVFKLLAQKQLELKNLLDDRELAGWRDHLSGLQVTKALHDKVGETIQSLVASRRILAELDAQHDRSLTEKTRISDQLRTQLEKQAGLEKETERLEIQLSLIKKIEAFEEARNQLQDGAACPLCGAMEHPFAAGNIPIPDETATALSRSKAALKATHAAVSDLRVKQAERVKDLEQFAFRKKECDDKIAEALAWIEPIHRDMCAEGNDQDLETVLPHLQNVNAEQLCSTTRIVRAAETLEKEISSLRASIDLKREAVAQADRKTQDAAHAMDIAQQMLARVRKEASAGDARFETALEEIRREVGAYGVEDFSMAAMGSIQIELSARRDQWVAWQKKKAVLEHDISILEVQSGHRAEQIRYTDSELSKQKDLRIDLRRERDILHWERREVFGNKNPDDEESRLYAAIERAEKMHDTFSRALNAAIQDLGELNTRLEALNKALAARAEQLASIEAAFRIRLGELGFVDEAQFVAACLPENERKDLMQRAQDLSDEQTELGARQRDKLMQLENERQKQVTDQSREELDQALSGFVIRHKEIQQEIGGIRQRLRDNDALRKKQQERVQAIEAQNREFMRWDLLHGLIGSADGKKYRNFAQGLTFEMMIGHANRQLKKMSDRYLLIRDDAQPLELNVIDSYQAGEVRSTKNLSGGESFIVSLSLALGLSHMASRKVRVDSLFLDEGFGTLDDEALDTALETLAGLHRDGKLIGVISHIQALRERIGTQIQVIPQTGGRSVIKGPGCGPSGAMTG